MHKPPPTLRLYIALTAVAATGVVAALLAVSALPSRLDWLIAGQVAALAALARCYPIHLAPKSKFTLDTAPALAALVLLPPAYAVISLGAGMLAGELWLRARSFQAVFNVSVTVLRAAAGVLVLRLIAGGPIQEASLGRDVLAVVPATFVMVALSILMVDVAVGLTLGRRFSFTQVWARHRAGFGYEFALALLGLVCAYAAADVPWVLGLMVVPGALIYHSLRDGLALRQRTYRTLVQLADLSEGSGRGGSAHGERVAALCATLVEALPLRDGIAAAATVQAGRLHQLAALGGPNGVGDAGAALAASLLSGDAAAAIVRHQFDRWDGGTEEGALRGDAIPLGARILAVADAFDHLTAHMSAPLSPAGALAALQSERGRKYDPAVLDALTRALAGADGRMVSVSAFPVAATG